MLVPRYQPVNGFRRSRFTARHALIFLSCVCLLLLWHWRSTGGAHRAHRTLPKYWSINDGGEPQGVTNWPKPKDFRIVGLVFFGRPVSVSILDCYLKRNLASNGGFLDEVIFLARTQDEEHLAWLDKLLETEPAYTRVNLEFEGIDYATAYDVCENGTMYIKMDDDLVFIEDHAIATIVQKKLNHPEYFVVAANVVNQPSLSWMHWRMGAIKPYLPELEPPPPEQVESISRWRASDLPTWAGPPDWTVPVSDEEKYEPPFEGHRWLPLPEGYPLENTPIASTSFDAFSQALWHWSVAAQEHYSFLENLEKNELWRYKFHTLDYYYMRMGIQMIAIWGDDIIASDIHHGNGDDEYHFTEVMTKQTGRHAVVDGRAIVSHYTFLPQRSGLESTDLLDRYRAFAAENICPR
ncbi:uncharacterized protein K452DRAFT_253054 [Aplosporella prunicola CBS 121167]|uniref:Uncharacterized protein n=1 Tax=Aplosporella prunicola CBS 121167 TaxID=1176127 RepID=A0A6A6BAK9_9PEZI|nr:uncharacterized protein K452DRAFT_253054 [Aplosporella prunicola CBS 121167]KAF2140305.1 hypothetical protein K452DRAFT_253054 [Aplosporella prunicola CBS 121167]